MSIKINTPRKGYAKVHNIPGHEQKATLGLLEVEGALIPYVIETGAILSNLKSIAVFQGVNEADRMTLDLLVAKESKDDE